MIPTLIASFYGMNVDIHLESFPHALYFHHTFVGNIISSDIRMVQKDLSGSKQHHYPKFSDNCPSPKRLNVKR